MSTASADQIGPNDIYLATGLSGDEETFRPRGDLPSWHYTLPLDWSANPYGDLNWQSQLHMWRIMDPLLTRYFKNGDTAALEYSAKIAVDWLHWHTSQEARYSWDDMAAGIRALKIAFLIKMIDDGKLSSDYRTDLVELAREHANRLQVDKFINSGNHGLFQVFGLNLLCSVTQISECTNGRDFFGRSLICSFLNRIECYDGRHFAAEKFKWILSHQFTPQGVHKENSPSYHRFAIRVIEGLGGSKRFDDPAIITLLEKAKQVEPWLILPNGYWPPIGDSEGKAGTPDNLNGGRRECLSDGQCYALFDIDRSGYAIVRSEDPQGMSMLFVTGMRHSWVHNHADDLSFVLYDKGRLIFTEGGKYSYQDDPMRHYIVGADAHNTISVKDHYIGPDRTDMTGTLLDRMRVSDGKFIITGNIERPKLFTQKRTIYYVPGKHITIEDSLSSDSNHDYISSLYLAPDLEPVLTNTGFEVRFDGNLISGTLTETDCTLETVRGRTNPTPLGWTTVSYLKMEPTNVIRAICPGQNRNVRWEINMNGKG